MLTPKDLRSIIERIRNGTASTEDEEALRRSLQQSAEAVQIELPQEPVNFNIGKVEGKDVHIGDRITIEQILGQKVIYISVDEIKTREFNLTSPYKGLKKFEPEDKDCFFGRDQFITELANELEQTNLLLLLGASGSGKSSVVRAGLLSWLQKKYSSRLVNLTFTPDQDPFESLYASLLRYYKQADAQVARDGREDTLTQVVTGLRRSDSFWFIFVDQFEELFTTSQADKRDRFIGDLVRLTTALKLLGPTQDCPVKIVATMRADFLDRLSPYPMLVKATDKHRPLIAEMRVDELRQAIEQPAAHHGVVFATGLVEEIIKDVQGQAGYLPLLQYTLNLLWEHEAQRGAERQAFAQERTLYAQTYRNLEGVRGALQQRVEQIYGALTEPERAATQRIFLKLVEIGGDEESGTEWKPVRKRALRSEFKDSLEERVLTQLINENLLVSDRQRDAQESTVEIAHEILLTSWDTLHTWIKENRQAIALRNRLNDDVQLWQAKKKEDELWTGSKLEQVVELRKDPTFHQVLGGFSSAANQFIDVSLGWRDRIRKRQIRQARIIAVGSIGAIILVSLAGGIAMLQQQEVTKQKSAVSLAQISNQLERDGVTAMERSKTGPLQALLQAMQAGQELQSLVKEYELTNIVKYPTVSPIRALQTILDDVWWQRKMILQGHQDQIINMSFSPDGQRIITDSLDGTTRIWNLLGQELVKLRSNHRSWGQISSSFSPNGQYILTTNEHATFIWNSSGRQLAELNHQKTVKSASFSSDSQYVITSEDGITHKWDLTGREIAKLQEHREKDSNRKNISPDGKHILNIPNDYTIRVLDLSGHELAKLQGHRAWVTSASFSSNSQYIITASGDGTARIWNLSGRELAKLEGDGDSIESAKFSPDDRHVVTASGNIAYIWNLSDRKVSRELPDRDLYRATFSSDGKFILTIGRDNTARVLDSSGQKLANLKGHKSSILGASFSHDMQHIVTYSIDETARIWDLSGREIAKLQHKNWVTSASFSPDGQRIVTTAITGGATIWDLSGREVDHLEQKFKSFGGSFSPEEGVPCSNSASFSPDGQYVLVINPNSSDQEAHLWNLLDKKLTNLKGHQTEICRAVFSPNGQNIVTASGDGTARIWDLSGRELANLQHKNWVTNVSFSPDGQYVLTTSGDIGYLWNLTGQEISTLQGYQGRIISAKFSPNSRYIVTASGDGTARIWDLSGRELANFQGHKSKAIEASFSPDSQQIITVSGSGTARIYNVQNLEQLLTKGCEWLESYLVSQPENLKKLTVCQNNSSVLIMAGRHLAKEDDIPGAEDFFRKALKLDPNADFNPETPQIDQNLDSIARKLAAPARLLRVKEYLGEGKIEAATTAYEEASKLDSALDFNMLDANSWNGLCWQGSLKGLVDKVISACERAVILAPENEDFRDSRGVARVLTGNRTGAIEDFQAFIEQTDDAEERAQRQKWIFALHAGQNPLTSEELENLRDQ